MTDFYTQLIEKSGFSEALIRRALDFAKNTDINEFSRLFFDDTPCVIENTGVLYFEDAFYPFMFFDKLKELNIPCETAALYIYIALSEKAFSDFKERIQSENIFYDTFKKISEDAKESQNKTGNDSIFDYRFLANHVRGNILRLAGFEYQHGHFNGGRAIILHLPENADLSKENRLKSYRFARQYFGDYPIIGDSWILYPENKKMLSQDSRIIDFMDDFRIVSSHETTDYSEAFHVFGRLSDFSYDNLPKTTSLQKAYAERIKAKLPIGSGIGILKY